MKNYECVICKNSKNGIILKGNYICLQCESHIVNTNVNEKYYDSYVDKIKESLFK